MGQGPSVNCYLDCVFLTSLVIGYNYALIIGWMMARFSRCFGRNHLLKNKVPTKFQIFSHPGLAQLQPQLVWYLNPMTIDFFSFLKSLFTKSFGSFVKLNSVPKNLGLLTFGFVPYFQNTSFSMFQFFANTKVTAMIFYEVVKDILPYFQYKIWGCTEMTSSLRWGKINVEHAMHTP